MQYLSLQFSISTNHLLRFITALPFRLRLEGFRARSLRCVCQMRPSSSPSSSSSLIIIITRQRWFWEVFARRNRPAEPDGIVCATRRNRSPRSSNAFLLRAIIASCFPSLEPFYLFPWLDLQPWLVWEMLMKRRPGRVWLGEIGLQLRNVAWGGQWSERDDTKITRHHQVCGVIKLVAVVPVSSAT